VHDKNELKSFSRILRSGYDGFSLIFCEEASIANNQIYAKFAEELD